MKRVLKRFGALFVALLTAIGFAVTPAAVADDTPNDEFPGQRQGGGSH